MHERRAFRRHASAWVVLSSLLLGGGCASGPRSPGAATDGSLHLHRVVLYQNGVGYFERAGAVEGDRLRLKVRKDQINDLLKSLAVIDRSTGKVLSVSLPLDPRSFHRAALAATAPGQARLARLLQGLVGTPIEVETKRRTIAGRIVMIEERRPAEPPPDEEAPYQDHMLTLLDGDELRVVAVSEIQSIAIGEGDVVMQLGRQLDAAAGEGMFERVELTIRLSGSASHDLVLSYVAPAPQWKPTYRVVLERDRPGKALLQAWAVVDNVSGENWDEVSLSLTAGAPIAFRYDLHSPREVERPDMSHSGAHKRAAVAIGERTVSAEAGAGDDAFDGAMEQEEAAVRAEKAQAPPSEPEVGESKKRSLDDLLDASVAPDAVRRALPAPVEGPSLQAFKESGGEQARAKQVSGLTRFDLPERVTLPDGSATMVTLVNQLVRGEEAFLFRPGGSGRGYEHNPYRVVRFHNDTEFVLEPGPISIFAEGSFVGEGLSEAIGSREMATIPFAVEPSITVRSSSDREAAETRIVKIVRGVIEVESFQRVVTRWTVSGKPRPEPYRVLIRHPRQGERYELVDPPPGTEELPDAYFVPIVVPEGHDKAEQLVVERTPSRRRLSIWDGRALELLDTLVAAGELDQAQRAQLQSIVELRRKIGRVDSEIAGLEQQRSSLDQRAAETRKSLKALKKDPKASALRGRLGKRLEEFVAEADALGRRIVELQSQRLEHKIALEDKLEDFELE